MRTVPVVLLPLLLMLPVSSRAQAPTFAPSMLLNEAAVDEGHDESVALAADSAGHVVAAWHATDAMGGASGRDADILTRRSTDGGRTWDPVKLLASNARSDHGNDRGVRLATDGTTWLAVWVSEEDLDGKLGSDMDLLFSRSTDAGQTWSDPRPLNVGSDEDWGDDSAPTLATDGKGTWVVVWESKATLGNTLGGDPDLLVARSRDAGQSWSAPAPLEKRALKDHAFDLSPALAVDGHGTWQVVWSSNADLGIGLGADRDLLVSRSEDGGLTWSEAVPLAANAAVDSRPDWEPSLAADSAGNWVCVWSSSESLGDRIGFDRDLLVSVSSDSGRTWSAPQPLAANAVDDAGDDSSPVVVQDGQGHWLVVWISWDLLGGRLRADADVLVSASGDLGRSWTFPVPLDPAAADDYGEDLAPALVWAGDRDWVAAWHSNEPRGGTLGIDQDVFAARARFPMSER